MRQGNSTDHAATTAQELGDTAEGSWAVIHARVLSHAGPCSKRPGVLLRSSLAEPEHIDSHYYSMAHVLELPRRLPIGGMLSPEGLQTKTGG